MSFPNSPAQWWDSNNVEIKSKGNPRDRIFAIHQKY
jgi:hypothetical protein